MHTFSIHVDVDTYGDYFFHDVMNSMDRIVERHRAIRRSPEWCDVIVGIESLALADQIVRELEDEGHMARVEQDLKDAA